MYVLVAATATAVVAAAAFNPQTGIRIRFKTTLTAANSLLLNLIISCPDLQGNKKYLTYIKIYDII